MNAVIHGNETWFHTAPSRSIGRAKIGECTHGAPRFPIRDHDGTDGVNFQKRIKHLEIEEVIIA